MTASKKERFWARPVSDRFILWVLAIVWVLVFIAIMTLVLVSARHLF